MMTNKIIEKRKLLLETTAQIGRLTGTNEKRQRIHKIIKIVLDGNINEFDNSIFTSSIVYCEFLNLLFKDILIIRNLIFNEFLQKKQFKLKLHEIDENISDSRNYIIKFRAKRLFKITAAIKKRFPKSEVVETKRVINFLNCLARDLAFRDFFNVRINNIRKKIDKNGPNYLNKIRCLSEFPFQEGFQMDNNGRYLIEHYENLKDENGDTISISNKITTTKCGKNPIEDCGIEEFFEQEEISQKIKKLTNEIKEQKPFSTDFRKKKKNKKWIELMQNFTSDDFNDFKYRRENCRHFFDMFIALQCPEDAYILSNDNDYDELGKIIDRPDLLLNFDEYSQKDN